MTSTFTHTLFKCPKQVEALAPAEPVTLSPEDELSAFLESDETRLGEVYRGLKSDATAEQIAENLGVKTSNFVWNYTQIIEALLKRSLPTTPGLARQVAARYRTLLKQPDWTEETRDRLRKDLALIEAVGTDEEAQAEEVAAAHDQTKAAEESGKTGIYVYSLPHYLRYPYERTSGRTLMKVGRSDRDVIERMRGQTRTTALPEEPVLLRIYPNDDNSSVEIEKKFHETLRAVDSGVAVQRMAGREWFLTTTLALDAFARLMDISIEVVSDVADYLEEA